MLVPPGSFPSPETPPPPPHLFCVNYCNAHAVEYIIIVAAQYKCPILLLFRVLVTIGNYLWFPWEIFPRLRSQIPPFPEKMGTRM